MKKTMVKTCEQGGRHSWVDGLWCRNCAAHISEVRAERRKEKSKRLHKSKLKIGGSVEETTGNS
jgi:hypothetical protein